jgi:PKD repeat protein
VTATDANGCFTVGTYDVNYFAPMTLGFSRQDDCGDGISWLSTFIQGGGTAPFNYAWSSGDTTAQTGFLPHGNYTVTVTDSKSCSVASSQLPIFDKEPNAAFGYSSSANDISFFDSLSYPADSETWDFGDGNSSNSANPNHTYADTGYYNVTHIICIDDCGCDTLMMTIYVDGSITSTIVVAGIQNIELYPNPNNGLFTVDWQGIQIRNIKIWSVDGRLVYNRNIDNQVSQNIDMSKTATGVYIVQLEDVDGWIISRKVLVE